MKRPRDVLLIDNLDSFSFNLVDAFERLGAEVRVVRNTVSSAQALALAEARDALIVLSPGPGGPRDAGCCMELVTRARGSRPVLGVCLGHQVIVEEAGGTVGRAPAPVHGKAGTLTHKRAGAFAGLPSPLKVARYHSLAATHVPSRFRIDAMCGEVVMAISDPDALQTGLQFHPESILTPDGDQMLRNLLAGASGPG